MKKKQVIVLLGPQGSGKGTQSKLIAENTGLPVIGTGNILRKEIDSGSELGAQIAERINKGNFVSDELANQLVEKHLEGSSLYDNGYILDGYPRSLPQVEFFVENILTSEDELKVIVLELSEEESIVRLSNRRVCEKCGSNFHLVYNKPKDSNICDSCGGDLEIREDDKPEFVKKRLSIYHDKTMPLINYFEDKTEYDVVKIDAHGAIDEITSNILKNL